MSGPTGAFLRRHTEILELVAHRRDRGKLWRRVANDHGLSDAEQVDLLEMIRVVIRYPVTVDADAAVRRMTSSDLRHARCASETEGGPEFVTTEDLEASKRRPGAILPTGEPR
jgi:hypothetical protein